MAVSRTEQTPKAKSVSSSVPENVPLVRPDASFKIKDSLRQIGQQTVAASKNSVEAESEEVVDGRKSFDVAGLDVAVEKYITDHRPDPTVCIALKTHQPVVKGEQIIFFIDNQLQIDKLENLKRHFQIALMKSLSNGSINITFQLFNNTISREEKKLFTASEKFEHFIHLNPAVANLKTIFGLELE